MKKKLRDIKSIFLTLTLALALSAYANSKNSELNHINKNIASIQTDLQQASIKKSQLQNALKKTGLTENQIQKQIKKTQGNLSVQQKKLQQLQQQSIPLANENNINRTLLKQQIRAAYIFSQQPFLKLTLAPNDIEKTRRLLMYFHYITTAQMKSMTQLQQSLTACEQNQQAIKHHYKKLLALKKNQLANQQALQKIKAQKKQLIQIISQHIKMKHHTLVQLLQDKNRLEKTIRQLNQQTQQRVYSKKSHVPNLPFAQLRGKLSWPLPGTIRHQFGTQIYQSELKWDGVVINAHLGQPAHAVAAGRVIFAKRLAGYGLLLIINHGNGYMTLYGRNQTLTKQVGDWVGTNETIGTVGKSGGFAHPALYFSVRHNGVAINPVNWCR